MALSASTWASAALGVTSCAVVTSNACVPARTITAEQVLILVLDKLRRGGVDLSTATSADLSNVTQYALCALQDVPYASMDIDKLKALVIWATNQA